jgi:hypothetical protein
MLGYCKHNNYIITIWTNSSVTTPWSIVDKKHATYVSDSFIVLMITSIFDGKQFTKLNGYKIGTISKKTIEYVLNFNQAIHVDLIENYQHKTSLGNYTGLHTTYHKNGNMKVNVYIRNGEYDGVYLEYNIDGKLIIEQNYEQGVHILISRV